jgi:hypothetical protein
MTSHANLNLIVIEQAAVEQMMGGSYFSTNGALVPG